MPLLESRNKNYFLFAFKKILWSLKNVGRYVKLAAKLALIQETSRIFYSTGYYLPSFWASIFKYAKKVASNYVARSQLQWVEIYFEVF